MVLDWLHPEALLSLIPYPRWRFQWDSTQSTTCQSSERKLINVRRKSRVWRKIDLLLTTTILKETPRKLHAAVNSYKSVLIVEISIHQSVLIIQNHPRKMITQSGWVKVCATWNVKPLSFSTLHLIIGCIFSILFYIHFSIHFLRC